MTNVPAVAPTMQSFRGAAVPQPTTWVNPWRVPARGELSYFRTYEQVRQAMFALQAKYPDLVRVRDFGDTAEKLAGKADRDLLALEITNRRAPGDAASRPATLDFAGIHAREIANPELLMRYATQLLEGFGTDPDATMIVNTRRTILAPIVNPDGHVVVERGIAGERGGNTMHRKSTGAGAPNHSVDLNRNFDFHWGNGGSSTNPGSDTYRGPGAASEPETLAMQRLMHDTKPTTFIDWHSYSKLNMYPWGDVRATTPDHAALQAAAAKFSTINGYKAQQIVDLYPTSGTTSHYAYGAAGIRASFAVETGSTFLQSDREFQQTLRENLPVLTYHSKIADAPLQRVFGPDASDVRVDAANRTLTAVISDARNGNQLLAGAELVTDPFAAPGSGTPLAATDGSFNAPSETVSGAVGDAAAGALLYVRGRDAAGNWGPLTAQWASGRAPA